MKKFIFKLHNKNGHQAWLVGDLFNLQFSKRVSRIPIKLSLILKTKTGI